MLGEELIKSKKTTSFDLLTVFKGLLWIWKHLKKDPWSKFDVSFSFLCDMIEAFHFITAIENGEKQTRNTVDRNLNII